MSFLDDLQKIVEAKDAADAAAEARAKAIEAGEVKILEELLLLRGIR